jgi:hypothetical protein
MRGCALGREVYHYVSTDRSIDAAFFSAIVRFIITGISILVVAIPEVQRRGPCHQASRQSSSAFLG